MSKEADIQNFLYTSLSSDHSLDFIVHLEGRQELNLNMTVPLNPISPERLTSPTMRNLKLWNIYFTAAENTFWQPEQTEIVGVKVYAE